MAAGPCAGSAEPEEVALIELRAPYLVFLGGVTNPLDAKTGRGLVDWRPELCAGQLRHRGCAVDLGLPEMGVAEAANVGVGSLVVGSY